MEELDNTNISKNIHMALQNSEWTTFVVEKVKPRLTIMLERSLTYHEGRNQLDASGYSP